MKVYIYEMVVKFANGTLVACPRGVSQDEEAAKKAGIEDSAHINSMVSMNLARVGADNKVRIASAKAGQLLAALGIVGCESRISEVEVAGSVLVPDGPKLIVPG